MCRELQDLLAIIKDWSVQNVSFLNSSDQEFMPRALKLPFMLGSIGIIYGKK